MSELKADKTFVFGEECDAYKKSEADKYIAELENRIEEGDKDFSFANNQNERLLNMLRHQKYKRCLAMARWCASRSASWCLDPADEQLHKSDFYDKWKKRWLELAEKFKEA